MRGVLGKVLPQNTPSSHYIVCQEMVSFLGCTIIGTFRLTKPPDFLKPPSKSTMRDWVGIWSLRIRRLELKFVPTENAIMAL